MTTLSTVPGQLTMSRVERYAEFDSIGSDWRSLARRCPGLSVFSTWEWCKTIALHYAPESPLWVLAARDGDDLIGIAPLVQRNWYGIRTLVFLDTGLGRYSRADYQDFLIAPGFEEIVMDKVCAYLEDEGSNWDMLWFQEVPCSSLLPARLEDIGRRLKWHVSVEPGSDVHTVDLPNSWDAFKLTLSANARSALERKTRKLIREHGAEFSRVESVEELPEAMNSLFDLHTARWQSKGQKGIFDTERSRLFYRDLSEELMKQGWLDLTLLKVGGEAIGAQFSFEREGVSSFYIGGFAPDKRWVAYSPGLVMHGYAIRKAIEAGLHRRDFLRGDADYKSIYGTTEQQNSDLFVFRGRRVRERYRALLSLRSLARGIGRHQGPS